MSVRFITAIRATLALPVGRQDVLSPLADVFGAGDSAARESALIRLVHVLNAGTTVGALADATYARSTLLNPFRYERDVGWRWGTHLTRRQLVEELWRRSAVPSLGAATARAAFLLALEQGFPFGFATMLYLLGEPSFEATTGWDHQPLAAVRSLVEGERRRNGTFAKEAQRAAESIRRMIDRGDGMDDEDVMRFFAAAEKLSQLCNDRPDVQMRLANLTWRVCNLSRSRGRLDVLDQLRSAAARWSASVSEPHLSRWLQEAVDAPPREIRTAGNKRVAQSDLLR
jgi:hypothetical protein